MRVEFVQGLLQQMADGDNDDHSPIMRRAASVRTPMRRSLPPPTRPTGSLRRLPYRPTREEALGIGPNKQCTNGPKVKIFHNPAMKKMRPKTSRTKRIAQAQSFLFPIVTLRERQGRLRIGSSA